MKRWLPGLVVFCFCLPGIAHAQQVQGTIYDISQKYTIPFVSVQSTSGNITMTDSAGFYSITVQKGDSIWFSYLGKQTPKYAAATISNPASFDISIQRSAVDLPGVFLKKRSYRMDSLQNREEFAKLFNYRSPGFKTSTLSDGSMGAGVGIDLTELINSMNFRKNKSMKLSRDWLIREEQDKYIDFRFNKQLIQKLTFLYDEEEVDRFMKYYRPDYELIAYWNDAELGLYIKECLEDFKKKNRLR